MRQDQPSDGSERTNIRTIVEVFSLVLSFSFALSALFFYFVFRMWGVNYFFIASVQDVIFGGLFTSAIISSVTFLFLVIIQLSSVTFSSEHTNKDEILKRHRKVTYGFLISVVVILYISLVIIWYNAVPSWFVFRIDFDDWTYHAIVIGIQGLFFVAMYYFLGTKFKVLRDRFDVEQLFSDTFTLLSIFLIASLLLFLVGREAANDGFVRGVSVLTPQQGVCEERISALWIGERYVVGRCGQRVLLLPSGELVLGAAGD